MFWSHFIELSEDLGLEFKISGTASMTRVTFDCGLLVCFRSEILVCFFCSVVVFPERCLVPECIDTLHASFKSFRKCIVEGCCPTCLPLNLSNTCHVVSCNTAGSAMIRSSGLGFIMLIALGDGHTTDDENEGNKGESRVSPVDDAPRIPNGGTVVRADFAAPMVRIPSANQT